MCQAASPHVLLPAGCSQLDYDALASALACCSRLVLLDLQQSTVVLRGSGPTGQAVQRGSYRGMQTSSSGRGGGASGSRRDACVAPTGTLDVRRSSSGGGRSGGRSSASCSSVSSGGLEVLLMSECCIALEGLPWPQPADTAAAPGVPAQPSQVLLDLLQPALQRQGAPPQLRVLRWRRASSNLVQQLLVRLVPAAAGTLQELQLDGSSLPPDAARCWQCLAAATGLTSLGLGDVGLSRVGYASACGTNPTAALLAAAAGMRSLACLGLQVRRLQQRQPQRVCCCKAGARRHARLHRSRCMHHHDATHHACRRGAATLPLSIR